MSHLMLKDVTAVGASAAIDVRKLRQGQNYSVHAKFESRGSTEISAVTVKMQGSLSGDTDPDNIVVSSPGLVIGSTAEKVANVAFDFRIAGVSYSKAAVAAGTAFSAAHVVSASKWGAINMYINAAGTIFSRVPLATQAYDTAEEAHAAADLIPISSGAAYLGRVLIAADGGGWLAITDDLTDGSDLTTANFLSSPTGFEDFASHTFTAGEITAQQAVFHVANKTARAVRVYLSTLTGTGKVNVWMQTVEVS